MADEPQRELPEPTQREGGVPDVVPDEPEPAQAARRLPPRPRQTEQIVLSKYEHSGPLPDEHWFQAVEQLHTGATEMLLTDYRDERQHVREMEKRSLSLDERNLNGFIRYQMARLWIAGSLAALLAVAGIVLIAVGLPIAGLIFLVAEIAGLTAVFFGVRRRAAQRDNQEADTEIAG